MADGHGGGFTDVNSKVPMCVSLLNDDNDDDGVGSVKRCVPQMPKLRQHLNGLRGHTPL